MIYEFGNQYTFTNVEPGPRGIAGATEVAPQIAQYPQLATQISDLSGRIPNTWERGRVTSEDIQEDVQPGFRYLDEAMKLYWSDIRLPTKDMTRFMRVRIAGANKSLQVWTDDLKHGRVQLPVMSISRGNHSFNPDKFSPAKHPMARKFVNPSKTRVKLIYRPVPYLVEYTMSIWAETKRDAESAINQILTRYNPITEFRVSDNHVVGNVQLRYGSCNDVSDKESSAEQLAKIKYEITTTAEAWLSLPDKVLPTAIHLRGGYKVDSELINWDRFKIGVSNGQ